MNNNSVSNISVELHSAYYVMYVILYLEHWWIDCKINITMTRRKTWRKIYEKVDSSGIFFTRKKQDQLFTLLKKLMSFIHSCLVFSSQKLCHWNTKTLNLANFLFFDVTKTFQRIWHNLYYNESYFENVRKKRLFFFVILGTF